MNQFLPPDPAPTARLLGEVAEELAKRGHEVAFAGERAGYRGGKTLFGSRSLREGLALLRLWWKTVTAPRCDAIVFLTSPPLLPVAVRAAGFRHAGAKRIHWAMDLYPDVAVALGEVREGSLLHRITARAMRKAYEACDLVVALDDDMADRIGPERVRIETLPPWPPAVTVPPANAAAGGGPFVWLYSGNLGRAHEWRTLLEAQRELEAEGAMIDLVFQGGGAETEPARRVAEEFGLRRCHWRDYAPEEELLPSLLAADALVVTQRPETAGCLWPSKLALALRLDRPVLWVGATDGGIAGTVRAAGHAVVAPGGVDELANEVRRLARGRSAIRPVADTARILHRVEEARRQGIGALADWLEESPSGL